MRQLRRRECGQALVLMVLFLVSLLGMATLVLDVGSWYRSKRQLQSTADAAALAGAQALPNFPGDANSLAQQYATKNASDLSTADYSIGSDLFPNDRITVHVTRNAPGFFAKIFGVDSVQVGATATAQAKMMAQAKHVAPIVVKDAQSMLGDPGCPCFGPANETIIPLRTNAPGGFALVDLSGSGNGTVSSDAIADWIVNGYPDYLPVGKYLSDPGAKFNNSVIQDALNSRIGSDILFPVYDTYSGGGANAGYHVIGWAAFHLEAVSINGQGSLTGYFTEITWDGLAATTPSGGGPNFGAHTVQLVG
ncbi:MAG TPA: pilus assembly protein TadG-related protein [Gaiellaceae bacterium]